MSLIGNLFKKRKDPIFDIEKAVGIYLEKIPRCGKDVVIASPKYKDSHYKCEILVAAENLLYKAELVAEGTIGGSIESQVTRLVLPIWLRGADLYGSTASYMPIPMNEVLDAHVSAFITEGKARIYCNECQSFIPDIQFNKLNAQRIGDTSVWTDDWRCPQGHQLYYEDQEIRFFISR